jgi:hypothetical protein
MTRINTRSIRRRQQRGVILLAIISLLTMFMLIGITYVVVSGHFKRAAITNSQARQLGVPPQKHLDSAMYQLLRDTELTGSAVRGHSLLQDKYGHFSIKADVSNFSGIADGQILRMEADLSALPPTQWNNSFLNGRVITFMDGDNKNISGRILKSAPLQNSTNHVLHILFPKYFNISGNTSKILINGRDFSGTGFGLVANAGNPRYGQLSVEALLPNRSADTTTQFSTFRRGGANEGYDVPDYQNMAMAALLSNPNPANRGLDFVIPSFHRPALINYWRQQGNAIWQNNRDKVLMRPMPWPGQHPNFTGSNPHWRLANGGQDVLNQNNQNALLYGPWDIDNDGDGHPDSVWVDMGFPIQTDSSGRQYKPLFAILCTDMDGRLNLNAHGNQMHYLANTTNAPVQLAGGGNSTGFPRGSGFGPAEINLGSLFSQTEYRQLLMGVTGQTPGRYKWDSSPGLTANPAINFNGIDYFSYFIFGHHPPNFSIPIHRYTSFQSMPDIHGELAHGINRSGNVVYEVSQTPATGPLSTAPNVAGLRHTIVDNPYELNMVSPQASDQLFTAHELEAILRSHDPDNPYTYNSGAISGNGASRIYKLTNSFDGNSIATAANRRSVTSASFDPPVPSVQIPNRLRSGRTGYQYGSHASQLLRARMLQDSDVQTMLSAILRPELQEIALNNLMSWTKGPDGRWGTAGNDDDGTGTPDDIFDAGYGDDTRSPLIAISIFDGLKMNVNRPFGNGVDDPVNGVFDGVVDNFIEAASPEQLWPTVFGVGNQGVWFDHDNDGIAHVADPNAFLARYHYARQLYVLMLLMNERGQIDFGGAAGINDDYSGDGSGDEKEFNLAQWAVNAVDFRDADSIMTPFEFDLNPFNGWNVDGNINTLDNNHRDRAVVWGSERPELLITESLVYHDRRTEDLDNADTGDPLVMDSFHDPLLNIPQVPVPDIDFDQRLLPRSGAFFELYNPWHSPGINPAGVGGTGSWQPAEFYRNTNGVRLNQTSFYADPAGIRSPVWRMIVVRGADRHSDPDHWDPNLRPDADHVERAIYFSRDPAEILNINGAGNGREQYYSNNVVAPLLPGRYAVIGSSGDNVDEDDLVIPNDIFGDNTKRSFIGRHSDATPLGGNETLEYNQTRHFALTPNIDPTQGNQVRLLNNLGGFGDAVDAGTDANAPPIAIVIDSHIAGGVGVPHSLSLTEPLGGYPVVLAPNNAWDDEEPQLETIADEPLDERYYDDPAYMGGAPRNAVINNRTTIDYAVVHLQRLANPLQPYHATTNPYRTIDSHSIDVTAFNGVENDGAVPAIGNTRSYRFNAHQRGDGGVVQSRVLWQHEPNSPVVGAADVVVPGMMHVFSYPLQTTLGFLNTPYGAPLPNGEVNDTTGHPFPWLQWNNRPFVSQFELMMVPRSRSSRLLHDYAHFNNINPFNNPNNTARQLMQYDHLLNFFESGDDQTNFHRLFDYTEVPSHYAGAQTFLNPHVFQGNRFGTNEMHPPFNRISNFRDPGRININTIFDPVVYNGLMNGHPGTPYSDWIDSRRGYGNPGVSQIILDNNKPTFFSNPLRPSGSGDIVPLPGLGRSDVDVSLFRKNPNDSQPLFDSHYPDRPRNVDRNPSFKYQSLQRLGNLVTGRSNVYGVWITVGYFEVEPAMTGPDATRPDGFRFGAEVGIDRGQIKRHRAFYMIDRSIPVAFEPGENHNVDKAVILRRYID